MDVYARIADIGGKIAKVGISKSRENKQQGYKFRGIDEVYNVLAPLLAEGGLVILPRMLSRSVVERQTKTGGALFYITVEAEFDFVAVSDGSKHTARTFGEAMDSADKATNKAMSAAYKYAAFQTFCIPTEGDNDADATTHEVAAKVPDGYENWLLDFELAASEGLPTMREAYRACKPEYRTYLETHDIERFERLKVSAKAATEAVPA